MKKINFCERIVVVMKIKVAMLAKSLMLNGISNVIRNYTMNLDKKRFDVTVIACVPVDQYYQRMYKKAGIKMIILPSRQQDTIKYYKTLFQVFKHEKYHILHLHGDSVNSGVELFLAAYAGIKIRIMHSHNTVCNHPILHKVLLPFFKIVCTDRFACGKEAGEWIFGKDNFFVIPNGFETETYKFNAEKRYKIRNQLNITDKFVIGHVGRINYQKNQTYLLEIFEGIASKQKEAILLLVGTGPYLDKLTERISKHKFRDNIILYGQTENPADIYCAMDIFAFPSRFEGLPVVLLEAQMAGLPCVVSDRITREVDFGDIVWKSIDDSPVVWANAILGEKVETDGRELYYDKHFDFIKKYQINENVNVLENLYLQMYEKKYKYSS